MTEAKSLESASQGGAEAPNTEVKTKKPYQKPVLRIYGDISSLTHANALLASTADGGPILQSKTH
jgi:hypothetical protein